MPRDLELRPQAGLYDEQRDGASVQTGCFFCRSGSEERFIADMKRAFPGLNMLSPKKVRLRRRGGSGVPETVTLFPGYVFFRTSGDFDPRGLLSRQYVYRLLTYPNGDWRLHGPDLALAEWAFMNDGVVGLSRARYAEDGLRFVDGALKRYEDKIVKINRRAGTAQIRLMLMNECVELWLGYEIIYPEA